MDNDAPLLDAERLYRAHVDQVGRWAARLGGPTLDLKDTVHEVFVIACARLSTYNGRSSVATWLFGITDKVVRHRRRKERWRQWLGRKTDDLTALVPESGTDPCAAIEQRQTVASVYRVLDRLSQGDRRILILFELEEMSAEQVGEILGIKAGTARLRLHRARARFARVYEKFYREPRSDSATTGKAMASSRRCENVHL